MRRVAGGEEGEGEADITGGAGARGSGVSRGAQEEQEDAQEDLRGPDAEGAGARVAFGVVQEQEGRKM